MTVSYRCRVVIRVQVNLGITTRVDMVRVGDSNDTVQVNLMVRLRLM